jgi:polyhydroxyalkanoate synthesis regulator phasin
VRKVKDQARRLVQLEEMLNEMQLRPMARRRCLETDQDAVGKLERQVSKLSEELEVRVCRCTCQLPLRLFAVHCS